MDEHTGTLGSKPHRTRRYGGKRRPRVPRRAAVLAGCLALVLCAFCGGDALALLGESDPPRLVSITRQDPASEYTNANTIVFRATFSEAVQFVTAEDFRVSGSTAAIATVESVGCGMYDLTVSGGDLASTNGAVGIDLSDTQDIVDLWGNPLLHAEPTTDESYLIDNIPPTIPNGLFPADEAYTVYTSPALSWEASTDPGGSGIRTSGAYRVIVAGPVHRDAYVSDTDYEPTLSEGTFSWKAYARDNAGNHSEYSAVFTLHIDRTPPDATIDQSETQADPSPTSPAEFTVVFDEPIDATTFTNDDVAIGGTATAGAIAITQIEPYDNTKFTVSITLITDGSIVATVPAGRVQDRAGNPSTASTSTDNAVIYDGTPPEVTVDQAAGQADPANTSPLRFTAIFSEPIDGATLTDNDIGVAGTATAERVTVTEAAPYDGTVFSVAIVAASDGTVAATVATGAVMDLVGHANAVATSTDNVVTYDSTPPTVVGVTVSDALLTAADIGPGGFAVTVQFDEPMDPSETPSLVFAPDIVASGTLTPCGSSWSQTLSPCDTFTVRFDVSGLAMRQPSVTIDVMAARDLAGNEQRPYEPTHGAEIDIQDALQPEAEAAPSFLIVPAGTGSDSDAYLDRTLPLDEGDEPPMVHGQRLVAAYPIGTPVTGGCTLADPNRGNPVVVSYVIVELYRLTYDQHRVIEDQVFHGLVRYDRDTSAYRFSVDTGTLPPAYYDLRLAFADGTVVKRRIELIPREE